MSGAEFRGTNAYIAVDQFELSHLIKLRRDLYTGATDEKKHEHLTRLGHLLDEQNAITGGNEKP